MRIIMYLIVFSVSLSIAATRYDKIINKINELGKAYPDKVSVISIGINNNGDQIIGMRISSTPSIMDYNKIGMLAVGTHHGNEGETADIIMGLAYRLVEDLDTTKEFYLIPVLNIPGYNKNSRWENGYDPNRDYPSPCKTSANFYLKSTKALADLMLSRTFAGSLTLHGFIGLVAYPWGISTSDTQTNDDAYFKYISELVAKESNYSFGNSTDAIYPADGCFEDWAYWKTGAWSLLIEIRNGNIQDIQANINSTFLYFKYVNTLPSSNHTFTGNCDRSLEQRSFDK